MGGSGSTGPPAGDDPVYGNLHTSRVSLIDAALCMNLINESLFNIVIS